MNSINLTGRLTADPEAHSTSEDTAVAEFRLAVQRRRGRGGEDRGAVYVDIVAFGGLAGSIVEYLGKGRQVAVSGRLEHDQWEAEDGSARQRHKVIPTRSSPRPPARRRGRRERLMREKANRPLTVRDLAHGAS